MAEQDFELYLSLLSRFLRLKPAQRQEISDELRDHLEERLDELTARGLSREAAIRAALEEFGDAAELANHFTHVSRTRKRRMIMRLTFGTAAALAASLLVATAFWPEGRNAVAPGRAIAQGFGGGGGPSVGDDGVAVDDEAKQAIETKLSKRIGKVEFSGTPLSDAIEHLAEQMDVDILFDHQALSEEGLGMEAPVELKVRRASLTARGALELVLEPYQLNYTIRDGVIMITTSAKANQIQVYNVRDLLHDGPMGRRMMGGGMGSLPGMARARDSVARAEAEAGENPAGSPAAGQPGMMMPGGMGGGMMIQGLGGMGGMVGHSRVTASLADLIARTIAPESWCESGGQGSILQYDDLLVVKNTQAVHGKVKALLEMLRSARRSGAPVPAGAAGRPGAGAAAATEAGTAGG